MSSSPPLASQRAVLLIDDEPLVRMGTAFLLEELGYRVVQASTAAQGLQLLSENADVEIMVTDFRMPDCDGLELIELAKQQKPSLKAVLMTGYAADDERFANLGLPRLSKPFGITDMESALDQIE